MKNIIYLFAIVLLFYSVESPELSAQTVTDTLVLEAMADVSFGTANAVVDTPANGMGDQLFVGQTGGGAVQRSIIQFDIAGSVPYCANITSTTLTLKMNNASSTVPNEIGLHPSTTIWSEGPADPPGGEGQGAVPAAGDATWFHSNYPTDLWTSPGGDYGLASASTSVSDTGIYTWGMSAQMNTDVGNWLSSPVTNFGWVLVGEDTITSGAKRFASRSNPDLTARPTLTIIYTYDPSDPSPVNLGPDISVCFNETHELDATTPHSTYLWSTGETTPTITVSTFPMAYSVSVTDTSGCYSPGNDTISINGLNIPPVSITPDSVAGGCIGESVQLMGSFGGGSQWYLDGVAIPGATTNIYDATVPGFYNMTKTNMNGCTDSAAMGTIVSFHAKPISAWSQSDDTVGVSVEVAFTDSSSPATDWCWDFGDDSTSTDQNPMHSYASMGTFTVTHLAKNNGCHSDSSFSTVVVDGSIAIDPDQGATQLIDLFPNPASSRLKLAIPPSIGFSGQGTFALYSITGKLVKQEKEPLGRDK